MPNLIDHLFLLLFTGPTRSPPADTRAAVQAASEEAWTNALDQLAPHKVYPLLAHRLGEAGLLADVPAAARTRLTTFHAEVRARNMLLLLTLASILRRAQAEGERVLLLKGILFADSYYPDPSTRPMSDIDLVASPQRADALFALMAEAGFRPSLHHVVQTHSITFMNREGVFCDAHRGLPMFADLPWEGVAQEVTLKHVHGVSALALEPHAMVAHVTVHMAEHARELGFVLLWIIDLAMILRVHGQALDPVRVRRLMANEGAWVLFLRILRMLRRGGEELPPALLRLARTVPPLTLGAALRQRRIIPWGLPAPLGWARLAAHQLGLHRADRLPPLPEDLVLWPFDALAAKVAPSLARVTRR